MFLSIEKAERLNARQLQSYYGVISVILRQRSPLQKIIRTPICFQGSYYLHMVETTGLANSDCYRRSIACSVTLVTAVQVCTVAVKPPEFEPVIDTNKRKTLRICRVFKCWWRQQDSNLWPLACEANALPAEPCLQVKNILSYIKKYCISAFLCVILQS